MVDVSIIECCDRVFSQGWNFKKVSHVELQISRKSEGESIYGMTVLKAAFCLFVGSIGNLFRQVYLIPLSIKASYIHGFIIQILFPDYVIYKQYFKFELVTPMDPTLQGPIEMPDVDFPDLQQPPELNNDLLMQIDRSIKGSNWIESHQCITMLRQINKFYPNFIPDVIDRYSNTLLDLFGNGKTQIIKNLLRFVKQVFDMGQSCNVEKAVYAFLPILLKKSSNDIGHIKQMSQQVLTSFSNNCGYQISFIISAEFCCDINVSIAEISIKLLAVLIQNIGQGIMQMSPEALKKIMDSLEMLIQGKRPNIKNKGLDICMFIYNMIGSENYLSLMNYTLQPEQVETMGCAMQNHRVSKKQNHVPLANVLKARKSEMMMQNQYMNQNINTSNMGNMGNMYGNQCFRG